MNLLYPADTKFIANLFSQFTHLIRRKTGQVLTTRSSPFPSPTSAGNGEAKRSSISQFP